MNNPPQNKKRLSAPKKCKVEIEQVLRTLNPPQPLLDYIRAEYLDKTQYLKKLQPALEVLKKLDGVPNLTVALFKSKLPPVSTKRKTKNQKVKDQIVLIKNQILQDRQDALSKTLVSYIQREYVKKQKILAHLEHALAVLKVILNDEGFQGEKIKIDRFKEMIETWKYFRVDDPLTTDQDERIMFRLKYYIKSIPTRKFYGYEIGGSARNMENIKKRIYIVDPAVFCHFYLSYTADHPQLKLQMAKWSELMGGDFIEQQCYDDRITINKIMSRGLFKQDIDYADFALMHGQMDSSGVAYDLSMNRMGEGEEIEPFEMRKLQQSSSERYVANKFIKYQVGSNIEKWSDLVQKPDDDDHPELDNSCMAKIVLRVYKPSHDSYKINKCGNTSDLLTLNKIYDICYGRDWDGATDIIMTPADSLAFFQKIHLGLQFFDRNNHKLFEYMPKTFHSHIKPSILRVIYENNHVEEITEIKSFVEIAAMGNLVKNVQLSNTYYLSSRSKVDGKEFVLADTPREVLSLFGGETTSTSDVNVIYNGCLNDLLLNYMMADGINPAIVLKTGAVVSTIYFPNLMKNEKPFKLGITNPCAILGFKDERVESVEEYISWVKTEETLSRLLINRKNLSQYDPGVRDVLNKYCINIPYGSIEALEEGVAPPLCDMVDFIKQYASCLKSLPWIPVISPFDVFEPYRHEPIKDDMIYLVEVCKDHIMYSKRYTIMFGFELKETRVKLEINVLFSLQIITRPIKSVSEFIESLFDESNTLNSTVKKGIPNKLIGMCGKRYNKRKEVQIFKNEDDARLKMQSSGGFLHKLSDDVWVVQKLAGKEEYINGFRPIREAVLSMARLGMFKLGESLSPYLKGVKTDACFIDPSCPREMYVHLLTGKLGGARLEHNQLPPGKAIKAMEQIKPLSSMPWPEWAKGWIPFEWQPTDEYHKSIETDFDNYHQHMKLKDEYDQALLDEVLKPRTVVMSLAGRGKSYAVITTLIKRFGADKVLVITPFNSQSHNVMKKFGVRSITFHKWGGMGLDGSRQKAAFNMEGFKAAVFDEVMLLDHSQLVMMHNWIKTIDEDEMEVYATGDPKQLEAIGDIIDNERKKGYVQKLFPAILKLEVNKRMKTEEDRLRMNAAEESLWVAQDLKAWARQHFQFIKKLSDLPEKGIKRGVAYFNVSAKKVNDQVHGFVQHKGKKKTYGGVEFYQGESLVCKKTLEINEVRLHTNYVFTIVGFTSTDMLLSDILEPEVKHKVPYGLIASHFALPYCNTVHSAQGDSIEEPFVILDWSTFAVTKNWLYTAISRASCFDHIYFLEEDISEMQGTARDRLLKDMVRGYKEQDKKKDRAYVEEEFVHPDWISGKLRACGGKCRLCGEHMVLEKGAKHKVTVNRLNNDLAHVMENCELLCKACNCALK